MAVGFLAANGASNEGLRFKRISLQAGLSQSIVYSICQDREGFMWFATQDGLNKYDGYEFTVYRPIPGDPNSISNNHILSIVEARDGVLWIGTTGGGLNKFEKENERFTHYLNRSDDSNSLSLNFVTNVMEDSDGNIWVGTNFGLNRLDPKTDKITRYFNDPKDPKSLSSSNVLTCYMDKRKALWFGTANGLNRYNPADQTFTRFLWREGTPPPSGDSAVLSICEDHSGEFWVGTVNGMLRLDRETGKYVTYRNDPANPRSLSANFVSVIFEDRSGKLWIGTDSKGISTFNRRTETFDHFTHDPLDPNSLGSNVITAIYEDQSGSLWIGSMTNGISRFDREVERFKHYALDPNNPNSLNENFVFALHEDRAGVLWIGTIGGGLNRMERRNGWTKFTYYRNDPKKSDSISSDSIMSILEDDRGVLWVGTQGGGLNRFNRETKTFKSYRSISGDPSGFSGNTVRAILQDSEGVIWAATLGGGLNKYDRQTDRFKVYRNDPNNSNSIRNNAIRALTEGAPGTLWVGTVQGLDKLDIKNETFTHYTRDINNPNSLSSDIVQCIYREPSGKVLWLGTFGGGLNRLDLETGKYTHYREKDGLPNDVVYGVLPDDKGNLWLSTNKGLSQFNPSTGLFKNYNVKDGLQSNEFNGGSYFKNKRGELFFGGVNGFNVFHPSNIKANKHVPPVVITDFQLFRQSVGIGDGAPLRKHISLTENIRLTYKQNDFSFTFVALNYIIPEKNRYQYMLEGFDKQWNTTGAAARYAGYTNIPPGDYVFRVRGANNDGVWNKEGVALKITIVPPFWHTWWFRVVALFFLLALLRFFYLMRMRNISRQTRLKTELQAARDAQMSIMPQQDPTIDGVSISGICVPANEVGGDFFDYFWLNGDEDKFCIVIADVCGKAMQAAMTAVMASGMLYSKVDNASSIKEIMTEVNRPLFRKTDKRMFTALCLAALNKGGSELVFTNAGLSEPLLKSKGSAVYIRSVGPRFPLGSFANNVYQETRVQLKSNDVLILFTDGISESQNQAGEFYGYDALRSLIEELDTDHYTAAQIKDAIIKNVSLFAGGAPQHDDITLVVIKKY